MRERTKIGEDGIKEVLFEIGNHPSETLAFTFRKSYNVDASWSTASETPRLHTGARHPVSNMYINLEITLGLIIY